MKKIIFILVMCMALLAGNTQKSLGEEIDTWVTIYHCGGSYPDNPNGNCSCAVFGCHPDFPNSCGCAQAQYSDGAAGGGAGGNIVGIFGLENLIGYQVGIDDSTNLSIYDSASKTYSVLISATELLSNIDSASGYTLGLSLSYDGKNVISVQVRSEIYGFDATVDSITYIASYTDYSFDLSDYRIQQNKLLPKLNGFINLKTNNYSIPIKFNYYKNSNLNLSVFNILGECMVNTAIQITSDFIMPNLSSGVYFVVISDSQNTLLRKKIVVQ